MKKKGIIRMEKQVFIGKDDKLHILAENGQQFLLKADTNSC
jgi:hypothetical protein